MFNIAEEKTDDSELMKAPKNMEVERISYNDLFASQYTWSNKNGGDMDSHSRSDIETQLLHKAPGIVLIFQEGKCVDFLTFQF